VRHSSGIAIAVAVGATAIAAPILISVRLAWHQSVAYEESRVQDYARDAVRRGDETGEAMVNAQRQLNNSGFAPCSPQEIDLMRRIDLTSAYLQAVGRISGNNLICTSLGTTQPIAVGPPTLISAAGSEDRLNVRLPITNNQPVAIISKHGIALVIAPNLPLDTATEGPDISLAMFIPSSKSEQRVVASRGQILPEWYRDIPRGTTATFVNAGHVVSVARSSLSDIAVVAAAPQTYTVRQVRHFTIIFVPIGVLCGLALAWTVGYISRMQLSLPSVLRGAARRREFVVEYQPIVDLTSKRWIGAEALVRWKRAGRLVGPDLFIPTAEESGVITLITACVAEIVAGDLPQLLRVSPDFRVSINLSAVDLRSRATLDLLERTVRAAGARPENLEVEATELGFLQGEETRQLVQRIRALGICVAIDDFGTGYSSLSRLEMLGPDALKIDKSFVDSIGTDGATSHVVSHIIEMGHSLHLTIVAEGVETEAQAAFLRQRGVGLAQGWLFGRPMPIRDLCDALEARRDHEEAAAAAGSDSLRN
jgi:sensor c-di-GMP phosphodiesterase-like protein